MITAMESKQAVDVLVVGAGLAGLLAASQLQTAGHVVQVVEKGRGVGGRLATWRLGPGRGDYGAQFFTVREPQFQAIVEEWLELGLAFEWSRGWAAGSAAESSAADGHDDGFPRYAITGGMTAVAKHLAAHLTVHTQTKLTRIRVAGAGWEVVAEDGRTFTARALLLTPPVPQSLVLLTRARYRSQRAIVLLWNASSMHRVCLDCFGWKVAWRCLRRAPCSSRSRPSAGWPIINRREFRRRRLW
jgi:renalase